MKNNESTSLAGGTKKINELIISLITDTVSILLFVLYSITAALTGMRILSRDEWDESFSNLMAKCSSILKKICRW